MAPNAAPRPIIANRATILFRVQSSASAQTRTSRAAAPDATQKRKCPTSGSMPIIEWPIAERRCRFPPEGEYAAALPCAPAARLRNYVPSDFEVRTLFRHAFKANFEIRGTLANI